MPTKEKNIENKNAALESKKDDKPVLSWSAADAPPRERDYRYYLVIGLAGLVLAVILALQGLWSGAVMVAIAAFMLTFTMQSKPRQIESAIFEKGVVIDDRAHDFAEFKSFWVSHGEVSKVKFQHPGRFAGQVTMPATEENIENIRTILLSHLPEEAEQGEDLTDRINRLLRF